MALVLDDHYWMVVDGEMNDLPIAAWTGFSARSSLHEPVHCRLRQYHAQAGLLVESVAALLDTMGQPPG
jgi:hypothetical protein